MNFSIKEISYLSKKRTVYKSPWAALLWSIAIPGFGQLYNRDYLLGIILVLWEITVNIKANINEMILRSFRGELLASYEVVDINWLMFYPSVFIFGLWQAYNKARSINYENGIEEQVEPYRQEFTFLFFGMVVGANFGIYYPILISPLFSGIAIAIVLGIIGHWIEKVILKMKKIEDER